MESVSHSEDTGHDRMIGAPPATVFVVYHVADSLSNILGVFSTASQVMERLEIEAPSEHIVVSAENLSKLPANGPAIIASKVVVPELRIARVDVDHMPPQLV
ncbi:MAG: hypothetical protein KDD44_06530 [Bdellovibrionales bacterium]|nr:hypothetical protein [Bdellovibrionales bacterium]